MDEQDHRALADLAMRAIDAIQDEYGPTATLTSATLLFEVQVPDPDGDDSEDRFHVNYRSLPGTSPMHIGGLAQSAALHMLSPVSDVE